MGGGGVKARKGTQATQGTFWWIEVSAAETRLQISTPFKTKTFIFLQPCLTKENLFYDPNSLFFFLHTESKYFSKRHHGIGMFTG